MRAGLIDPAEEHARRPLADHLNDYAGYMRGKGGTLKHVTGTVSSIVSMFKGLMVN